MLREEFGSVLAEDIQASLDAAGQTIDDFVERTISGFERLERFPLDAPSVALNRLSNSAFEFSAAVGDRFLPILARGAEGLTNFLDAITDTLNGTESLTEIIANLNAEITRATGQLELRTAVEGGTEALEAFIAQAEEAIRNNSVFFGGREDAFLTGQINEAREALEQLQGVQQGNIQTEADLRAELALQEAELERIQQAQTERNNLIAEQGPTARRASRIYLENLTEEEIATISTIEELEAKIAALEGVGMAAEEAADSSIEGAESLGIQLVRSADQVIRLRDAFRTVSEGDDIQAIETAASNLTSALESELSLQLMDAELTAADRLDLELSTARAIEGVNRDAQQRISRISQDRSDEEVAAAERQRDARIAAAERARGAEVAGYERARDAGASYAEQLAMIATVGGRREFVALVERLQEQGLSFEDAVEKASEYIDIINNVNLNRAEQQFGNFTSTLVRDADLSADAVANLTRNVIALGTAITENLQDDQTFIGFGRDITGRAAGTTIESDQQAAGQQGREFILRNFPDQARALGITPQTFREAQRAAQRAEQANQDYAASLNSVVGAIDELTPVIEGIFDIDISSPRSGGHLALDAASGIGQVVSGDVIGGLSSLISSIYEFGQPDAEGLARQHQQALERERQRVAEIYNPN